MFEYSILKDLLIEYDEIRSTEEWEYFMTKLKAFLVNLDWALKEGDINEIDYKIIKGHIENIKPIDFI